METLKNIVSVLVAIAGFANALLFVPQALRIWRGKNADGVSLTTFGGFLLFQLTFVTHGILHGDWALVSGMGSSFLTCGAVVALAIRYRQ